MNAIEMKEDDCVKSKIGYHFIGIKYFSKNYLLVGINTIPIVNANF